MKIKNLQGIVYDQVYVYRENMKIVNGYMEAFENLYNGKLDKAPISILNMEIRTIGAMKTGVIDISVD